MDTTVAFVRPSTAAGNEIVVNFGLLSGREATIAEVDRLARRLCELTPEIRVHAVRTHDVSAGSESVVHQVVAEAPDELDPEGLRAIWEHWAKDCAADRTLEPLGI